MPSIRIRALVTGSVQGVGFRMNTLAEARKLRIYGFVRNSPDGSVEVEAEGDAAAIDQLVAWLRHGPRYASVTNVRVEDREPQGDTTFEVL